VAELALTGLSKRYADHLAVDGVDLHVASGEFISLLGPSGCGKSTLLRMIAGLIEPTSGSILLGGADVTRVPTHRRGLGLVFQSYALFPHLSVAGNVAYGLRRRGVRGADLKQQVAAALALVRLGHLADRMPRQLSGGQQQRVALARAVAPRPRVLLLDEPLSNLDALLRDEMQIEIKRLQQELGITSVFVTHDQTEALSLSDRICVLAGGRVQQVGTPEAVYTRPANGFVAGFIGRSNRLRGRIETADAAGSLLRLDDGSPLRSSRTKPAAGSAVDIIIRNDAIGLVAAPERTDASAGALQGRVILRSFAGTQVQLVVRLGTGAEIVTEASTALPQAALPVGAEVIVQVDPAAVFIAPVA
jgi:ABC-type Fe3+/spermidine/putrescine transport system ATPase subunit